MKRPRLDDEWALFDCTVILLIVALVSLQAGCRLQALEQERQISFSHAVTGQAVDLATTAALLQEPGIREANPVFGNLKPWQTVGALALAKGAMLYVDWRWGDRKTDWITAVAGYGAGVWNVGIVARR